MRLASFTINGSAAFGCVSDDETSVVDFAAAGFAADLESFVALGAAGLAKAHAALTELPTIPRERAHIVAPFPQFRRTIMCVGKNYHEHAAEFHGSGFDSTAGASAVPDHPIIFVKHPSSIIDPGAGIVAANDPSDTVDYEGELGVIIGEAAFRVAKADAYEHVYGYTIVNDVTSRELQSKHKQWFIGKSVDTFCPMGPYVVTADAVGDVTKLRLQTFVNDELRQNAPVSDLIFDIPTIIATISATTRLYPGDVIATGTPAGVGIGFKPPKYLHAGDRVRVVIDKLGTLENPVV
jgi:2-keto-4-pentenoate hydratase/2-oxohepta-3-ene-1,7-dioic acid hydratase in catechol pathway